MLVSVNQPIPVLEANDMPNRHWHMCRKCQYAWNHNDTNSHSAIAHICPQCRGLQSYHATPSEVRCFAIVAEIANDVRLIPSK